MADSPLDKALKRKAELLSEVAEIDEFVRVYNRFSSTKTEHPDTQEISKIVPDKVIPAPKRSKKKASPAEIAKACGGLIRSAGKPLPRTELVIGLEKRGLNLQSKDKPRYVGTILWRLKHEFINLEGHGYWLVDTPYGPAGYSPPLSGEGPLGSSGDVDGLIAEALRAKGL